VTAKDVRKYAAEEAPSEQEAVEKGMEGNLASSLSDAGSFTRRPDPGNSVTCQHRSRSKSVVWRF